MSSLLVHNFALLLNPFLLSPWVYTFDPCCTDASWAEMDLTNFTVVFAKSKLYFFYHLRCSICLSNFTFLFYCQNNGFLQIIHILIYINNYRHSLSTATAHGFSPITKITKFESYLFSGHQFSDRSLCRLLYRRVSVSGTLSQSSILQWHNSYISLGQTVHRGIPSPDIWVLK